MIILQSKERHKRTRNEPWN